MLHRHLAGPGRPVQLHERERGALRGHERFYLSDPLWAWHLEQHYRPGRLHSGIPGILRRHQRVDHTDSLRCGDVQPQLILQLLHGLPGYPSWELLRHRSGLANTMLTGNLAGPDGAVQLHRCQPGTLCIWIREYQRDCVRPWDVDRPVGPELLYPCIPRILCGHQRFYDSDTMWFGNLQPQLWL